MFIEAGLPQESILGPLLFLIYINDLSYDLTANVKLFADDISLVSIVHNMNMSTINLKNDLNKIKNWAIHWKMNFKPDPVKQAQKVQESFKIQTTIKFISITTPLSNSLSKIFWNISWIFRNT